MEFTVNSRTLGRALTFSRPGKEYIFVNTNGRSGTLGEQICHGGGNSGSTITYSGDDQAAFERVCRRWLRAYLRALPDVSYEIRFDSGVRYRVQAKSIDAAKRQATSLATFGGGGYSVEPYFGGEVHRREFWQAGNRYGWAAWRKVN